MNEAARSYEMRRRSKGSDILVSEDIHDHDHDHDRVQEKTRPLVPTTLDSQVRIRRLFSFTQIFMFSLTYMGLWEGMCT